MSRATLLQAKLKLPYYLGSDYTDLASDFPPTQDDEGRQMEISRELSRVRLLSEIYDLFTFH